MARDTAQAAPTRDTPIRSRTLQLGMFAKVVTTVAQSVEIGEGGGSSVGELVDRFLAERAAAGDNVQEFGLEMSPEAWDALRDMYRPWTERV